MRFCVVVILFLTVALCASASPLYAQTATTTPAAGMPSNYLNTDEGTPLNNRITTTPGTYPTGSPAPIDIDINIKPDDVKFWNPAFNRTKNDPKALDTLPRFEGAIAPLTPKELNTYYALPENNPISDARISGVIKLCKTNTNGTIKEDQTGYFVSEDVKEYPQMDRATRKLAAVLGDPTYSLDIQNGKIPFGTTPIIMNDTAPPCDISETGTTVVSDNKPFAITPIWAKLIQWFNNFIAGGTETAEAKVVGKIQPNTLNRWGKLATGDDTGTFTEGEYTDKEQANIQESKGFLPSFKPKDADLIMPNKNGAVDLADMKDMMIYLGVNKLEKLETNTVCAITSKDMPDRPTDCGLVTKR